MATKKTVEEYAAGLESWQAEVVTSLRKLVREIDPDAKESIKWSQPVFEDHGLFAFIRPAKNHMTFGFFRGMEIPDPHGLFEGEGDRMRHVKIPRTSEIPKKELQEYIRTAVQLNRTLGDPTKRK